ncbi:hypothetical protein CF386_08360 [Paraphotobacterium marinum]|uniref:Histidine phosphatase family protein n=1 Tax=Paraphotobacterium marinum TaxID=1755811 RepID=A0A220VFW2_9GAMM|nr:hypothetical protein [Paraphotobacterium marinum]ASK79072.1 hypothetical protein CF386_08360 [Paraphotobacterium marinum]
MIKKLVPILLVAVSYSTNIYASESPSDKNSNFGKNTQVIVLLRHAEKAAGPFNSTIYSGNNLSTTGTKRSLLLPAYFEKVLSYQMKNYKIPVVLQPDEQVRKMIENDYQNIGNELSSTINEPSYIFATSPQQYWGNQYYTRPFTTIMPFANSIDQQVNGNFYLGWTPVNSYDSGDNYLGCYNAKAINLSEEIKKSIFKSTKTICQADKAANKNEKFSALPKDILTEVLNNWSKRTVIDPNQEGSKILGPNQEHTIQVPAKHYRESITYISWEHDMASYLAQSLIERLVPEKSNNPLQISKANLLKLVTKNYGKSDQTRTWQNDDYGTVFVFVIQWKKDNAQKINTFTGQTNYQKDIKQLDVYRLNQSLPKFEDYKKLDKNTLVQIYPINPSSKLRTGDYDKYILMNLNKTSPNSLLPINASLFDNYYIWPNEQGSYKDGDIVSNAIKGNDAMFRCIDSNQCNISEPELLSKGKDTTLSSGWEILCGGQVHKELTKDNLISNKKIPFCSNIFNLKTAR